MRPLLYIALLLSGSLTHCIGWDEYFGGDRQRYQSGAGSEQGAEMIAIPFSMEDRYFHVDRKRMKGRYYLFDSKRDRCFFQNGDVLAEVACFIKFQPTELVPNPNRQTERQTKEVGRGGAGGVGIGGTGDFDTSGYSEVPCDRRRKRRRLWPPLRLPSGCKKDNITKEIRSKSGAFLACYEKALRRNPKLAGTVITRWSIGSDGCATGRVSASGPDAVGKCIARQLKAIQFMPSPFVGGVCFVQWPFVLTPGT